MMDGMKIEVRLVAFVLTASYPAVQIDTLVTTPVDGGSKPRRNLFGTSTHGDRQRVGAEAINAGDKRAMIAYALYIATAVGALALFMMMPRRGYSPNIIGGLLGILVLGGLWLWLWKHLPEKLGIGSVAFAYQYVFSGLAIVSAVRVITHTKPIYAALWFVMVILASSGLFLTLEAEFMAFALVIIYGGAIMVTYLFVIMLAAHTGDAQNPDQAPSSDRVAYEPLGAVAVGFLLLAILLTILFEPIQPNAAAKDPTDHDIIKTVLTQRPDQRMKAMLGPDEAQTLPTAMVNPHVLTNTERVGVDLFQSHPLGLELAGVILLVSLVGAVVLARMRIDPLTAPSVTSS